MSASTEILETMVSSPPFYRYGRGHMLTFIKPCHTTSHVLCLEEKQREILDSSLKDVGLKKKLRTSLTISCGCCRGTVSPGHSTACPACRHPGWDIRLLSPKLETDPSTCSWMALHPPLSCWSTSSSPPGTMKSHPLTPPWALRASFLAFPLPTPYSTPP